MTADRLIPPADRVASRHSDSAWPDQARVIAGVLGGTALQLVVRDAGAVLEGRAMLDEVAEALDAAASVRSIRIDGAARPAFDDVLAGIGGDSAAAEGRAVVRRAALRTVLADRQAGRKTVLLADNADELADPVLRELYQFVSAFGEGGMQLVLVVAPPFLERIAEGGLLAQIGAAARVLALDPALPPTLGKRRPPVEQRHDAGGRGDLLAEIVAGLRHAADAMPPGIGPAATAGGTPEPLPLPDDVLPNVPEPAFKPLKRAAAAAAKREADPAVPPPAGIVPRAAPRDKPMAAVTGRAGGETAAPPQVRSRGLRRFLPRAAICTAAIVSALTVSAVGSGVLHDGTEDGVSAAPPVEVSCEGTSRAAMATAVAMAVAPAADQQPAVAHESAGGASVVAAAAPPSAAMREERTSRRDQSATAVAVSAEMAAATVETPPAEAPVPAENAQTLIGRGEECFAHGDVAGARLFFERAARSGSAQGMTALARTYDVSFLKRIGLRASLGDDGKATALYRQAASAGDADAARRLEPSPED